MELSFRAATEDDVDRLVEIHLASYPDPRGVEERRRNVLASQYGSLADLFVAERAAGDGGREIVGRASLFSLDVLFGGRAVKTGAVASVAVAPEARGQGVATALMKHLHVVSDVRGDAVTMLYAFRQGFYDRLGYAPSVPHKRLAIDPRAIPEAWRALARGRVRRARGGDRDAIVRAYLRAAARCSGWLARPEVMWDRIFARERRTVLVLPGERAGEIAGYAAFEIEQPEFHAETELEVFEIVADDAAARRALWGALGAMRDQVSFVSALVVLDDPLEVALVDLDRNRFGDAAIEHPLGDVVAGPMFRIEDVSRAIEARGYPGAGGASGEAAFDLVIEEDGDEAAVSVAIEGGRARAGAARGGGAIRTSRRGLAAVLYGGLGLTQALELGLATADARVLSRGVAAALALPPVLPIDPF